MPWIDPTPADLKSTASALAMALASQSVKAFIFGPNATFTRVVSNRIDVGMWTVGRETLLLVANMNAREAELELSLSDALILREVLNYGIRRAIGVQGRLRFESESLGCAIFILSPQPFVLNTQNDEP